MTVLMDFQDRAVRLTEERQNHIAQADDPDLWEKAISDTLGKPDEVIETFHHPELRLFYRVYSRAAAGRQNFYVIVKVRGFDMLIVTAFFGKDLSWGGTQWTN